MRLTDKQFIEFALIMGSARDAYYSVHPNCRPYITRKLCETVIEMQDALECCDKNIMRHASLQCVYEWCNNNIES